jgi:hypothetical protein
MSTTARQFETGWLPDTPIEDTLLRRFLANQIELNELLTRARGGQVQRHDEVALVDAGPVAVYLNQAVLHRPITSPLDPVLDEIDAFYANGNGLVVSMWPTPDLSSRGWRLMGHPAFVVRAPAPLPRLAERGSIRTVDTAADLRRFEQVMVDGYPIPAAGDGTPTFPDALLDRPLTFWLAVVDDAPVAAAAGHVAHGVVNLCMAATLPAARRRGAWASLVWARVGDDPTLPAVAFTSDHSRPGFERLGFLPITRFTLWVKPSLSSPLPPAKRSRA